MFTCKIGNENKYDISSAKFRVAFAFLKREDLATLPEGWIELEEGVRASVQHYITAPSEELKLETHELFHDVQYLVEGEETIGVVGREGLIESVPYDTNDDITFYQEPTLSGSVLLRAGDFVLLTPEDAHKPRCVAAKPMAVKKIVVKVPV